MTAVRLPPVVRNVAKRAFRSYGVATASMRPLPDFLIIGAKRGGTTSLYTDLLSHPGIVPLMPAAQNIKGVHFFDSSFHRGVPWYRSHFPTSGARGRHGIAGEASPYYLAHPLAAARARQVVPGAKVVLVLRNPVDRAFSHWRERVRHDADDLSFEDAIRRERERLAGERERLASGVVATSWEHEHHTYLEQGRYAELLTPWLERFPRERVFVARSEDVFADPDAVRKRLLRFLGLAPVGSSGFPRRNYHGGEPMDPAIRRELVAEFRPHNQALSELVGLDVGEWNR